jgi:hypothetical protein
MVCSESSTLTERFRYSSNTVFDTFPWPQGATDRDIKGVAAASKSLRRVRRKLMDKGNLSLRKLYRLTDLPGKNDLKTAQDDLDQAVRAHTE